MYLRNIIIYKHLFNVSIVRIKVARSTIGYSEERRSRFSGKRLLALLAAIAPPFFVTPCLLLHGFPEYSRAGGLFCPG
jgi:hypothetical protein